jgi:hypothetical protein
LKNSDTDLIDGSHLPVFESDESQVALQEEDF